MIAILCNIVFVGVKIMYEGFDPRVKEAEKDLVDKEFSFTNMKKDVIKNLFILIFFNSLTKIPSIGEELYDVYGKSDPSNIINKVIESENIKNVEVTTNKDNKFDKYDQIIKKIGEIKDNYFLDVVYEIKDISERKLGGNGGQVLAAREATAASRMAAARIAAVAESAVAAAKTESEAWRAQAAARAARERRAIAVTERIAKEKVQVPQPSVPLVQGVVTQPSVPLAQGVVTQPTLAQGAVVYPNPQFPTSLTAAVPATTNGATTDGTAASPAPAQLQPQPHFQSQPQPQRQRTLEQMQIGKTSNESQPKAPTIAQDLGGGSVLAKAGHKIVGLGLKALGSKQVQNAKGQFTEIAAEIGRDGTSENMGRKAQGAYDRKKRAKQRELDAAAAPVAAPAAAPVAAPAAAPAAAPVAAPAAAPTASLPPPPATLKRQSRQDLTPHLPTSTDDKPNPSASVYKSDPESESDITKFLQYFGVNADNDTNTVYFENLNDFEKNLIWYKEDILKKSLLYKIHDIYQGNDILSSFNLWAKMYIFERSSGVKSKTKQTMKIFSELLGKYIYILIKLVIVMWILYILFKSKKPDNFLNVTFKIFIIYYLIYTFVREKQLLLRLRNAFFRGI